MKRNIKFSIKNHIDEIDIATDTMEQFLSGLDTSLKHQVNFNIVLDEVLNNIISYAFPDGEEHIIEISVNHENGHIELIFADDGTPFDPLGIEDPDTEQSIEDRKIGGLGVYLVKNLMDDISYERRDGKNYFIVKKKI